MDRGQHLLIRMYVACAEVVIAHHNLFFSLNCLKLQLGQSARFCVSGLADGSTSHAMADRRIVSTKSP